MKLNKLSLNTIGLNRIGLNRIGSTSVGSSATDRPYISPDVLSSLAGVWIADGKSNTDPDRNIIKNKLLGRGGDFEILNAAYEGMSGCNGYPVVFGDNKTWEHLSGTANYTSDTTSTTIHITHVRFANRGLLYSYVKENGVLTNIKEIPAFRVTVKGLEGNSKFVYKYLATKDATRETSIFLSNGTHKLAKSFVPTDALLDSTTNVWIGMFISPISEEVTEFDCDITIEVLPEYEGAFVTDGVDDMIVSQNPVSEMLGGSNELTVVSMIHQITADSNVEGKGFTNYIRTSDNNWISNRISNIDKTGIYGYSLKQSVLTVINNILGDKNDYTTENAGDFYESLRANFSVEGFKHTTLGTVHTTSVAWYWTFIAKRVLTTDEINQVIAYFNLDKYVKPDIYYDVKKQGLTNDTPDEDWYLKDFSGNGRDMTLYNYAKTPESGINEEGGLQSDGVNDFGQFVGNLGLKDYTVVFDRAYPIVTVPQFSVISDATGENANTPFLLEHINEGEFAYSYSANTAISINKEREICYQSTYQYKDTAINRGSSTSLGTGLTIARYGINNGYSALVLYSFMLFHYSMSKFLIERQLKKRKLGTLYPGMVEFRPIVKSNIPYSSISYSVNPGEYVIEGSTVTITITLSNSSDKLVDISSNAISDITISGDNGVYEVTGKVTKSPQKISIVISSYLTMLNNDTLISNETLIKNE